MRIAAKYLDKIVVSVKRTRLEAEAKRLNLSGEALDQELLLRGFNVKNLHASHDAHHRSLEAVETSLAQRNLNYSLEHAKDLSASHFMDVTMVISVGGDGTLLETAQFVKSSSIPVLGVNSDPQSSTGKLCSLALRSKNDFEKYFVRMERDNFSWFLRSRVGLSLVAKDGHRHVVERAALNEVLLAERDVCRPTMHQTKVDDEGFSRVQRSCGVLVCSGSGSTAWMQSASAIRQDDAELILDAAGVYDFKHVAGRVAAVVNREFILPPTSSNVSFFIREALISPNVPEPIKRRGFASTVSVRSLGFDTHAFLDGISSIPVENGTTVIMSIHPEKSLRTFLF